MMKYLISLLIILFSATSLFGAVSWSGNTCTITGDATVAQINACLTDGSTGIVAQGKTGEVTVQLPADTQTWTSGISINMGHATYINVTSLIIRGSGTVVNTSIGSTGGTTITFDGDSLSGALFYLNIPVSKKFRLSNIAITSTNVRSINALIELRGKTSPSNGGGFRIDHLNFETSQVTTATFRNFFIFDETYGVFDHNYIVTDALQPWIIRPDTWGNRIWAKPIGIGTVDAVFIEDNYLKHTLNNLGEAMDGGNGLKVVFRNNEVINFNMNVHGLDAGSNMRGAMFMEVYNNTFTNNHDTKNTPNANLAGPLGGRSGTWMAFNNHIYNKISGVEQTSTGLWSTGIFIRYHRAASDYATYSWGRVEKCDGDTSLKACYGPTDRTPSGVGVSNTACTTEETCGGTTGVTSYCQVIDLNNVDGSGYPCRDQMGITHNNSTTSYSNTYQFDHYPSLFWNNTFKGTTPVTASCQSGCGTVIKENRDYCLSSSVGTDINGVTGGYRPDALASCGGHATTYTPYQYPHPLVGGVVDTTNPNDLTSLSPTGQQACATNPSNVAISLSATDNVAVTGVRCCVENGTTCTSATAYASRDVVLTNTSGTTWGTTVSSACDTDIQYNCMSTDGTNYSNNGVISYQMADNSDSTTPTMSTQAIGADGRTVTFTFSEAVTIGAGGSGGFVLTNGDSEEIALIYVSGAGSTTLTYQSSVCIPSTDTFTAGLVYTQPTDGIEDMAGLDLASFTGAGAKTVTNGSGQSCDLATSLFEHGESAPSGSTNASGNAVNLGVKFQTSTAATMTHCWFYKIAADTGTHTCTVYRVFDGSTVGTVDFADESESGWQDQAFASALNIAANEDYIVTVSHPTGNWTSNVDYFLSTYTNGNLTATTAGTDYAGRYVYGASMAFPVNDSARNYWVDFTLSYAGVGGPWQCTVSRTGDGCMITGSQVVEDGNTCSATVTLRNGWKATWGGTCPAGSESGGIYTTGNLSADCTLTAACTEQNILP